MKGFQNSGFQAGAFQMFPARLPPYLARDTQDVSGGTDADIIAKDTDTVYPAGDGKTKNEAQITSGGINTNVRTGTINIIEVE